MILLHNGTLSIRHTYEQARFVLSQFTWDVQVEGRRERDDDDDGDGDDDDDDDAVVFTTEDVDVTQQLVVPLARDGDDGDDGDDTFLGGAYADRTPYWEILVAAREPVATDGLKLVVVLTGKRSVGDGGDEVRWTSFLSALDHWERPYEVGTSETERTMVMNSFDSLAHAVATYNRAPRAWTGVRIKLLSVAVARLL